MAAKGRLQLDDFYSGLIAGDRTVLARAITLIESSKESDKNLAVDLLSRLQRDAPKKSIRIGFSGAPGVGKSSLIEAFGLKVIEAGHKVAVLAIDPSGIVSGGSILGDKVRMPQLSLHESAFIRPSPARGFLGGVAQSTHESILLCEHAGYDVVIVETVGVGQSEHAVRQLVDVFVLLLLAGAGDDLQTIKRGILECFDILAVTKCDGAGEPLARRYAKELGELLPQLKPATPSWTPVCLETSSVTLSGISELWTETERFCLEANTKGVFEAMRTQRAEIIFRDNLSESLAKEVLAIPSVRSLIELERQSLENGSPGRAVIEAIVKEITSRIVLGECAK
jgi:LAO/AO transport system kinase